MYIRKLKDITEYEALQQVQRKVWGFGPDDTVLHLPLMVAIQKSGGLVLGAFEQDAEATEQLVGFALGFIGRDEQTGKFFHYSQIAAALAEYQSQGIGLALKAAQRREVLQQGFDLIRWAFDPLEARNAYFNIAKLGGVCRKYIQNMYGPGRSELFGQLETDRLLVDWELTSGRVQQRLTLAEQGAKAGGPLADYRTAVSVNEIEWLAPNIPAVISTDLSQLEPRLKLEIPHQNKLVQKHALALAEDWRNQTRHLFAHYLAAGYYVADFFTLAEGSNTRAFYLLQKNEDS